MPCDSLLEHMCKEVSFCVGICVGILCVGVLCVGILCVAFLCVGVLCVGICGGICVGICVCVHIIYTCINGTGDYGVGSV